MSKYNGSFTKTETINTPVLQKISRKQRIC